MAKTLDAVKAKWQQNTSASQQAYVDGVQNTTVDPTQLAIANESGYLSGVQSAVSTGLWRRKLAAVGKAGWQQATISKAANFANGVANGADKYERAMQQWLPVIQQVGAQAKAMPGQTIDQRLQRSAYVGRTLYNRKRGIS